MTTETTCTTSAPHVDKMVPVKAADPTPQQQLARELATTRIKLQAIGELDAASVVMMVERALVSAKGDAIRDVIHDIATEYDWVVPEARQPDVIEMRRTLEKHALSLRARGIRASELARAIAHSWVSFLGTTPNVAPLLGDHARLEALGTGDATEVVAAVRDAIYGGAK